MKKSLIILFCLFLTTLTKAQYSVSSPNESAQVYIHTEKAKRFRSKFMLPFKKRMSVNVNGRMLIRDREIGMTVLSHGRRKSFGKFDLVDVQRTTSTISSKDRSDLALAGLEGRCNGLVMLSASGIMLEVVVFNKGMAYRYSTKNVADEYKIVDVTNVFPDDKPNAILGTFAGDMVFPWRIMFFDEEEDHEKSEKAPNAWATLYPHSKVVSWKDALPSLSIGHTMNCITGKTWGKVSTTQGVSADFTYKHLYGGLSFSPCQELLYVFYGHDFDPFLGVMGSVHAWDCSARFGYSLPVQNGYDIWSFAPYASATYLNLHQHVKIHPTYSDIYKEHHFLVGLGLKAQYMMRQRISFGVAYEYQFFTGWKEPFGRNTFIVTMGYGF